MKEIQYYILDVFAKNKYEGNQLAVFIDLEDQLDEAAMLQMAKEINFAESTFIKKKIQANKYTVKIFTTESEIPFAGHPTIGTSYIIAKHLMKEPSNEIILKLNQGEIKVNLSATEHLDSCLFKMTQTQPEFLKTFTKEEIASQLEIDHSLIQKDSPIQEISTGLPFIVIPIKNLESINKLNVSLLPFKKFLIDNELHISNNPKKISTSLFFFTPETFESDNDYNVRMFCIEDNILKEDAATGSANGCFLSYLLKYSKNEINAKVEQGFQMNRKSYLFLEGKKSEDSYDIKVGGYCKNIAEGKWTQ